MAAIRTAEVTWTGSLAEGKGSIDYVTSGSFTRLPVTWASRTEAADGRTSPEELLASAVTFDKVESGWKVVSSALKVRGKVPGLDAATFVKLAEAAKDGCPISGALKGNVALSVEATLEG
jgi:osmotically inducible protein OsmC